MARTALAVTTTAAAGVVLPAAVAVDGTNGNSFPNTGREKIEVINGSGSPITATFTANGKYTVGVVQYTISPLVVTVAAGVTKVCGPFDKGLFNDGTGSVDVDFSSATTVTARVTSLGTS